MGAPNRPFSTTYHSLVYMLPPAPKVAGLKPGIRSKFDIYPFVFRHVLSDVCGCPRFVLKLFHWV